MAVEEEAPLLEVRSLSVDRQTIAGNVRLVDSFSMSISAGERVGLVGESGAGKSVLSKAIMRLDPQLDVSGSIRLGGVELLTKSEREMESVRGSQIGMVFQEPMVALNPLQTIGDQLAEPLRLRGVSKKQALATARDLLEELGIVRAGDRLRAYPHEFSGGMRQRVVIAMALIGEPKLLIADEPTTALDVSVQAQVLRLLDEVCTRRNLAVLLITHDLGVVAGFTERVVAMYSGRKIEERPSDELFAEPAHPYTHALLRAIPLLDAPTRRLEAIPGSPPSPAIRPTGCAFHPRCPIGTDRCTQEVPSLQPVDGSGEVVCHLAGSPAWRAYQEKAEA